MVDSKIGDTSAPRSLSATMNDNISSGPQQGVDAKSQLESEAEEASSPEEAVDTELEGLALTSSITELSYALESVSTLIFEIQELRHLSASSADTSAEGGGQTTEVDASLLKLDDQLETTSKEVDALQARIDAYTRSTPAGLLRHKWDETLSTWHKLQKEAEEMREELVEDKYLTVYRTVSRQAEDMMQSLEKIFAQCNTFVHELYKSCRTRPNPDKEELQKQLNTFLGLHKSLHQKTKYYIPSCEKVLKVIDSGISQQKRSLNGEILRSHADMKLRWRNLQERMSRTEKEMQGVQELLSELSAKATRPEQQAVSDSIASSSASSSSRRSSSSTPSRSSATTARNKVGDWLSPSPSHRHGDNKGQDAADSPTQSRSITPFRRLANRLHRSKTDEPSPPSMPMPMPMPVSSSTASSSRASVSPETHTTPLPKQKAALAYQAPAQSAPAMPRTVSSPATVDRQNRRLSRLPTTGAYATPDGLPRPSYISSTTSERARSPMPPPRSSTSMANSAMANSKPLWSVSTRPPQPADLGTSLPASTGATRGRKSMPASSTLRNPSARYSQIGSGRPQSRIFIGTSAAASFRPPSPAFSATSNTSASAIRPRPSSPSSRIPAPGSSVERNGTRRHHGSPGGGNEDIETLYFGGALEAEEAGSSIMQRAFSPTPSNSGFSVTSSTGGGGRRQSRIPRLSLGDVEPPDLKMLNIPPPPKIPDMYKGRSEIMTPEPTLRSRAARVSAMYGGRPATTGRKSLGPGTLPYSSSSSSEYSTPQPQRSLAASTSGLRPSSRLSVGGGGIGGSSRRSSFYAPSRTSSRLASPLPDMPTNGSASLYQPNKYDPLDIEISQIVNSQPLYIYCQREGPPLSKIAAESQTSSDRNAFYWFGRNDKFIHCKLVDRGERKPKKVLCKVDGQYQDLAIYLLNQQAQY